MSKLAVKSKANVEPPKYQKIDGATNIRGRVVDGILYLKVDLAAKAELSSTGASYILAKTPRFASLSDICGEDIGLNLILTKKKTKKAKKKARDDDEEDD